MPTPGGLPKPGETWRRTFSLPPDWRTQTITVKIIERGRGDYWSLRVKVLDHDLDTAPPGWAVRTPQLWVDASYWFSRGELECVET